MHEFDEIDRSRQAAGVTRRELYERAGVSKETWRRTAKKRTEPNVKTLRKLKLALEACIAEQEARANGQG